jgi:ketosteroid isomerase-like protein
VPGGILGTAYESLGRGDSGPLLQLIGPDFEWVEPELAGYPLAGVHRGPDGAGSVLTRLAGMLAGLVFEAHEVAEAGERETVTGVLRGRPAGTDEEWELPFAHVWELDEEGELLRVRAYFDRSRLTLAATRRQLADVADDLIEQAAEIRRQWAKLGDALRAAGVEPPDEALAALSEDDEPAVAVAAGSASARLAAVDMAQEGASRDEVDAFLREELSVTDPTPILDEVFGAAPPESPEETLGEAEATLEARRLSRLFARNRG